MASRSRSEALQNQLEIFVENMRQLNVMVSDVQPQTQIILNQKIQNIVTGLSEIDKLKDQVKDVNVPMEVVDCIDKGLNPEIFTKDCLYKAKEKHQEVKGKIESYKKFKANLLVEMAKEFPKETMTYRVIRESDE